MDLRQLKYFTVIVEEGGVSQAARKLYLSQPPLTRQMEKLEAELGCPLFTRRGRSLVPTEEGRLLYRRAKDILSMSEIAVGEVKEHAGRRQEVLRLGIVSSLRQGLGRELIAGYAAAHPQVAYELYEYNTYEILSAMENGLIPVALVRDPFPPAAFSTYELRQEAVVVYGRKHWFPQGAVSLAELAQRPLVIYRRWQSILDAAFEKQGLTPSYRVVCDTASLAVTLAEADLGAAVVPQSAVFRPAPAAAVWPLEGPRIPSAVKMLVNDQRPLPQCAREFADYVRGLTEP